MKKVFSYRQYAVMPAFVNHACSSFFGSAIVSYFFIGYNVSEVAGLANNPVQSVIKQRGTTKAKQY